MLGQEVDSSFGDPLTLSLFFLGCFGLLWCSIFRCLTIWSSFFFLVIDVMSWWIQHFRRNVDYTFTQIIVQAIGSWSLAAATLLLASSHLNLHVILSIDPRAPRKWRLWSYWKHGLGCTLNRLLSSKSIKVDLFIQITVGTSWILCRSHNICSLKCIDAVQSWTWTEYLLLSQILVSLGLFSRFGEPLTCHVFSTFKKVEELRTRHQHRMPRSCCCIRLTTSPSKTAGPRGIRKLIDNRPWTLTIANKTTWNRNKVILLNELLRINQFQSLIRFMICLILPSSKWISRIHHMLCLI